MDFTAFNMIKLRKLCHQVGLITYGNKIEVLERLYEHRGDNKKNKKGGSKKVSEGGEGEDGIINGTEEKKKKGKRKLSEVDDVEDKEEEKKEKNDHDVLKEEGKKSPVKRSNSPVKSPNKGMSPKKGEGSGNNNDVNNTIPDEAEPFFFNLRYNEGDIMVFNIFITLLYLM